MRRSAFDSAKQIDGRKRFTLVDTLGLLMAVQVVAANVPERAGAKQAQGFVLVPKRWVVERTDGWLHWCRRLNVDDEHLTASSEALIYIARIRMMLRRLA
jgi:Transposase DDE domain